MAEGCFPSDDRFSKAVSTAVIVITFCLQRTLGLHAGRAGTCEVMIGCMAKALDDQLHMNGDEMDAVRWVTREEAQKAVRFSSNLDSASAGEGAAPGFVCHY